MASGDKEGSEHSHVDVMREEIQKLKDNVAKIQDVTGTEEDGQGEGARYNFQDLTKSVVKLNSSIDHLIDIFRKAGQILEEEDRRNEEKLDEIMQQNKEIAEGVIQIARMMQEQGGNPEAGSQNQPPSPNMQRKNYEPYYHLSYQRKKNTASESQGREQEAQRAPAPPPQQHQQQVPQQPSPPRSPQSQENQADQRQGPENQAGSQNEGQPPAPPGPPPQRPKGQGQGEEDKPPSEEDIPEPPGEDKGFFSRFKK